MAKTPDEEKLLEDMKNLVGESDGGDFSVDDILAEYGVHTQKQEVKQEKKQEVKKSNKILEFPGAKKPEQPSNLDIELDLENSDADQSQIQIHDDLEADPLAKIYPVQDESAEALDALFAQKSKSKSKSAKKIEKVDATSNFASDDENWDNPEDLTEDNIVDFARQDDEGMFAGLLRKLDDKIEDKAERMYRAEEALSDQEVHRREQFIPGTDYEEEYEEEESILQRLRREPLPPEDIPPRELKKRYQKGRLSLFVRGILVLVLTILGLLPLILPLVSLTLPPQLTENPATVLWCQVGLLGAGMLLSADLILISLWRGVRLKFGADTLLTVAAVITLIDGVYLVDHPVVGRELSYCSITLVALWLQLCGAYHKRQAQFQACKTAAHFSEPYLVTLDGKKWNAKDTYCKWRGAPEGFGSQIQMDDGGQRMFARLCPLLLIGCGFVCYPVWQGGDMGRLLWTASATLTAACALGASLCYGRSAHKLERRLEHSGAALAGWTGVKNAKNGTRVLLTDGDIFPAGSVTMKQPKFYRGHTESKVVAYTACLMAAADCGLTPLFVNYLRSIGGIPRKLEAPLYHEAGGISGRVWHDEVLVGSAAFMNLMGVPLQAGMHVNQSVFCAVNGDLAGVFPLSYVLHETIPPAVYTLLGEGIAPVLATRDFNLIPTFLSGRFRLPTEEMDFPVVERRRELSQQDDNHNEIITAVVCNEGLMPFSEAVVGAKRLRMATRTGVLLCTLASILGIFLTGYLTSVEAYTSASPLNLLIFLVLWLLPVWFLTEWSHRF